MASNALNYLPALKMQFRRCEFPVWKGTFSSFWWWSEASWWSLSFLRYNLFFRITTPV